MTCFYCKKKGHIVEQCPVLKRRNAEPVALIKKQSHRVLRVVCNEKAGDLSDFAPF